MKNTLFSLRIASLALGVVLLAPAPLRAQDEDDDRPATRAKEPAIPSRNEILCKAFEEVARKACPSVVSVGGAAYGVVLEGGIIVTTSDAAKGPSRIKVEGSTISAEVRVLGVDEDHGIGILEAPAGAVALGSAEASSLSIGQFVISIGTKTRPLAAGVLSARDRKVEPKDISQGNILMGLMSDDLTGPKRAFDKVLQHDSPMSEETLGSALVDSSGKLIGLNVGTGFRGSSYALAIDDLLVAVKALKSGAPPAERPANRHRERPVETPQEVPVRKGPRPYLGASVARDADGKLVVQELVDGGPAHQGGLRPQDKIVTFDGKAVSSLDDVAAIMKDKSPGDEVSVVVMRDGSKVKLKVTLGKKD